MPDWLAIVLGVLIGIGLIAASIWWAVKPPGARSKSLIPKTVDNPTPVNNIPRDRDSGDDD